MAEETSRDMSVRRIRAPGDDSTYVALKVIDKIRFVDPRQHHQEWELSFSNDTEGSREVHVVEVGEDKLKVERVDRLTSINQDGGRWQEWATVFDNSDDPPVHYETHKRKIYALNDDKSKNKDVWIEVQRIDRIWFTDPKEHYQERVWELLWPDLEDEEWDYKDLARPRTDWDDTSINPPWRLDPFQTIVDCSFGASFLLVLYGSNSIAWFSSSDIKNGTIKLIKKKTLAESNWSASWDSKYFKTQQLKLAKGQAITLSPVKGFISGVLSYSDNLVLTTSKFKSEQVTDGLSTYDNPFFCGSENSLKMNFGSASISSSGVISGYSKWPDYIGDNAYGAFFVNNSGDRYYGCSLHTSTAYTDGFFYPFMDWASWYQFGTTQNFTPPLDVPSEPSLSGDNYFLFGQDDWTTKRDEAYTLFAPGQGLQGWCGKFKGAAISFDYTVRWSDPFYGDGMVKPDMTLDLEYAECSSSGGINAIANKSLSVVATEDYHNSGSGYLDIAVGSYYTKHVSAPPDIWTPVEHPDVSFVAWPPTLNGKAPWLYIREATQTYTLTDSGLLITLSAATEKLKTPYGDLTSPSWDATGDWDRTIFPSLHPWLHLSDGKNTIQAVEFGGERFVWINGVNKSAALASAIGCDPKDIKTMLLDISGGTIDKLK